MHVEQLFAALDATFGPSWRTRLDDPDIRAAIEAWIEARLGHGVSVAIDNLPEEA